MPRGNYDLQHDPLGPCPFCGSTNARLVTPTKRERPGFVPFVACDACGALGPASDSVEGAAKAWNAARGGKSV